MSLLETDFENAAERIKNADILLDNRQVLQLYGLYKQARNGDCNLPEPWAVQVEARAKWNAWNANKGLSKDEAMGKYINLVAQFISLADRV